MIDEGIWRRSARSRYPEDPAMLLTLIEIA